MKIVYFLLALMGCLFVLSSNNADDVVGILESHSLDTDIDAVSVGEKKQPNPVKIHPKICQQIRECQEQGKPLVFTVTCFPYKSPNFKRKVLCSSVDGAERYSLVYLNDIMKKISKLHGNNVQLIIYTDGLLFCDVLGVPEEQVFLYEENLKKIASDLKHIKIQTLSDMMPTLTSDEIRITIEGFASNKNKKANPQGELDLLKKRLTFEFDYPQGQAFLKEKNLDQIVHKMLERSQAYSIFLDSKREKESIRLSVHYQPKSESKIGIRLSPNSSVTPWHGVLVEDSVNNVWHIKHREDVDLKNFEESEMVVNNVRLKYYKRRFAK